MNRTEVFPPTTKGDILKTVLQPLGNKEYPENCLKEKNNNIKTQ